MTDLSFASVPVEAVVQKAYILHNDALKQVDANTPIKNLAKDLASGRGTVSLMKVRRINGEVWQVMGDFTQPNLTMSEAGYAISNAADLIDTIEMREVVKGS